MFQIIIVYCRNIVREVVGVFWVVGFFLFQVRGGECLFQYIQQQGYFSLVCIFLVLGKVSCFFSSFKIIIKVVCFGIEEGCLILRLGFQFFCIFLGFCGIVFGYSLQGFWGREAGQVYLFFVYFQILGFFGFLIRWGYWLRECIVRLKGKRFQ